MEKTIRADVNKTGAATTDIVGIYKEIESLIDKTVDELAPLQTGEYGRREVSASLAIFQDYVNELKGVLSKPEAQKAMSDFEAKVNPKIQAIVNALASEKGEEEQITADDFAKAVQASKDLTDDEKYVLSVNMKHGELMGMAELLQQIAQGYEEADRIKDRIKK